MRDIRQRHLSTVSSVSRFPVIFLLLRLGTHLPKELLVPCELCFKLHHFEIRLHTFFKQLAIVHFDLLTTLHFAPETGN